MNIIQKSMNKIQASEELKQNTLQLLANQPNRKSRFPLRHFSRIVVAAACLFFVLGAAGYSIYVKPVSYISIDTNPSIELGINRFGMVVLADAYNQDGQEILSHISLKNISYMKAVNRLLQDEARHGFLSQNSTLVFTVISDNSASIIEALRTDESWQFFNAMAYTTDMACRGEAHQYEMSFGKYRAYLELIQYDATVSIDDCHKMNIGEIQSRIEGCKQHNAETENGGNQNHHRHGHDTDR